MYFLDTSTCLYFLQSKHTNLVTSLQTKSPQEIKLSIIVVAELLRFAKRCRSPEKGQKIMEAFMVPFELISFDTKSAYAYASLSMLLEKQSATMKVSNIMMAATCLARKGATLVTTKISDFSQVPGLRLEDWTTPS